MLARRLNLKIDNRQICTTPLLVPAFSSKVIPKIGDALKSVEEYWSVPILISAYDVFYRKHSKIRVPINFGEVIFVDSGGYECSRDAELADVVYPEYKPREWTPEKHRNMLDTWSSSRPTVFTSYDHPYTRISMGEQIEKAKNLLDGRQGILTEILLKPETKYQQYLQIESIEHHIGELDNFDIIGVTEKELGSTILKRMETIARIRLAMEGKEVIKPLHVFGSLDTIATTLYFISGADIFDGLTWLRYAFVDGVAIYEQNYGILNMPLDSNERQIWVNRTNQNLKSLGHLRQQLIQYSHDGKFKHFSHHRQLFENSYNLLMAMIS